MNTNDIEHFRVIGRLSKDELPGHILITVVYERPSLFFSEQNEIWNQENALFRVGKTQNKRFVYRTI